MPRFEMRSSTAMAGAGSATPLPDAASATPVVPHAGERESASGLVASPNSNNSKDLESCLGSSGNTTEHSDFVEFATEFRHLRLPPQQGGGARLPQETQDLRKATTTSMQQPSKREDETPCSPHARDGSRAAGSMGGQSSLPLEQTREPRRAPFLRQEVEVQQDTEATTAALRDEIRILAEARTRLLDHANNLEDRFGAAILSLARDADLDVEQVKDRFGKLGLRVDERGRADWNKVSRAAQEITGVPGGSVDTALELLTTQTALAEHADLQILARECNAIVDDHFRNERLSGEQPLSGGIGGASSRSITQLTSLIRSVFDELRQPGSGAEAADHRQTHDQELRREVATQKALREDERRRYNLKEDAWKREIGEMGEMLAILSQTEKELVALLEAEDAEFDDEEGGGASQRRGSTADAGAVDKGPPGGAAAEDRRDLDDEDASRATAVEVDGNDPASGTAASPVSRPRDSGKKSQKKSDGLRESVAEHDERLSQLRNSASKLLRTPPLVRKRLQTRTPSSLLVHEAEETKGEEKLQLGGPTHLQRTPQEKLDELAEKAPRFLQMSLEYADNVITDLERRCERDSRKDDDCARCLASVRELKVKFNTDLKDKLLQWLFLSMQQNQNGSPAVTRAPYYNDVDGGASGGSSPGLLVRIATPAKFSETWLRDLHEVLSRAKDIHADVATFRIVRELNDNKFLELERARAMLAGDLEAQRQAWQQQLKEKVLEVETYYDKELSKMEEVLAKSKAESKKREDQLRKLTQQTQLAGDAQAEMRLAEIGNEMENIRGKHAEEMEELRRNLSAISAAALDCRDERIAALEAENDRLNRANRGFAPLHDNLRKTIDDLKSELTGQLSDTSNDVEVLEQMLLDHEKQLEQWRQQIEDKDPSAAEEEEMPAPSQHSRGVSAGGGSKSSAFRPASRGSSVGNMHGAPAPTTRARGGSKEDMTPNNGRGTTTRRRESSPGFNENNVRTFLRDNRRPFSRLSVSGEREATPEGGSFDKFIEKLEDSVAEEVVAAEVGAPLVPAVRMKPSSREDSQGRQKSTHANPPPRPKSSNTTGAYNKSSFFRESDRFSFPVFLNGNDYENVALAQGPPQTVQPQTQFSHRQETEAPSLRVPRPRPTGSSEAYVEPSGAGRRENRATAPAVYYHPNRSSVTEEQPRITDPPTAQRQVQAQFAGEVPSMRIPRARATSPPEAFFEPVPDEEGPVTTTTPAVHHDLDSLAEGRQTSIKRLPPRVDEVRHRVLERVKASLARASAGTADAGLASTPTPDPAPTSTAPVVAGIERSGSDSTSSHQSKRLQQLVRANMQRGRTTVPAGETAASPGAAVATPAAAVADADEEAPGTRNSSKEVSLSTRSGGGRLVELDTPVVMDSIRTRPAVVAVPRPDDTHFPTAWQIVKRHTATSQNTATSQDDNDYRL
mmetsp:Transcript_3000/g.6939  ORF Transcript_3000/g.6939 Transcript_3000/m.6939 type:complete len:1422 (+) Transcript_3000:229-4494(+)